MKLSLEICFCALCVLLASAEGVSVENRKRPQDTLLEVKASGTIGNGVVKVDQQLFGKMDQQLLTPCSSKCIQSVLTEAKHFHAGAASLGDCMYTTIEGNSEPFLDEDGNERLTEEECDDADGDWVENVKGGPVDVLLNAFKAFRARDGGAMKMFFTVVTQGFYLVKDRLVTTLGIHHKMRSVWMEVKSSVSQNLGDYSIRTEKKSLYDMARRQIQEVLNDPISKVCSVLPAMQVGFLGNGISISLSELCVSALASIINNYLGWMKKQIKSMIKRVFKQKGMAELGRQIVQAVTAPLGYVFTQFENGLGAKLEQIFIKIRRMFRDLQVAKIMYRNSLIEDVAKGYCWDDINKEMFNGDDKESEAREQYADDLKKIKYKTIPVLNGLDGAIEDTYVLQQGFKQDKTIVEKMERLVYLVSLIFDPRVANVWTSDMLDALITSGMTKFATAFASEKQAKKMLATAKNANSHINGNALTKRPSFNATMEAMKKGIHVSIEELEANHERDVETLKADCWKDVKGAKCYSLYHKLRDARARDASKKGGGGGIFGWAKRREKDKDIAIPPKREESVASSDDDTHEVTEQTETKAPEHSTEEAKTTDGNEGVSLADDDEDSFLQTRDSIGKADLSANRQHKFFRRVAQSESGPGDNGDDDDDIETVNSELSTDGSGSGEEKKGWFGNRKGKDKQKKQGWFGRGETQHTGNSTAEVKRGWFGRRIEEEGNSTAEVKRGWFGRRIEEEVEGNLTKKSKRGWFGRKVEDDGMEEAPKENELENILKQMEEVGCPHESVLEDQWMNEAVAFLELDEKVFVVQ